MDRPYLLISAGASRAPSLNMGSFMMSAWPSTVERARDQWPDLVGAFELVRPYSHLHVSYIEICKVSRDEWGWRAFGYRGSSAISLGDPLLAVSAKRWREWQLDECLGQAQRLFPGARVRRTDRTSPFGAI